MMRLKHVVLSIVICLGIAFISREARAWCQMRTGWKSTSNCQTTGVPLQWRRANTIYALYGNGSEDFTRAQLEEILGHTFGAWNSVRCSQHTLNGTFATLAPTAAATASIAADRRNTIVFVVDWCSRGYCENDPLTGQPRTSVEAARTTVWHNVATGEIYDADIEINEQNGPYRNCPEPNGCVDGSVDLQNILTHEVGHYYGLGHPSLSQPGVESTTMYFQVQKDVPGEIIKRTLEQDDEAAMCSVYSPRYFAKVDDTYPFSCSASANGLIRSRESMARSAVVIIGLFAAVVISRQIRRRRRLR